MSLTSTALPNERRAVVSLAMLYAFRMMGLFMVLPVLTLYGDEYVGSSPQLLGLALGAYGCSQALLQIPFGIWSDRWGRKQVIAVGLILFALGSVIAASAETIYGLILGRFLQGGGAIASAIMAMVADLTSDQNRTKAMASIGASIGLSFSVALIIGPLVSKAGGVDAVFWITALFAVIGLAILFFVVPKPVGRQVHEVTTQRELMGKVLRHSQLLRLDFGIFVLHFVLMASFVVLPSLLRDVIQIPGEQHWWVYLPLLGGAFIVMLPFMIIAEKKRQIKWVFSGAVALLAVMQGVLAWGYDQSTVLLIGLFCFFVAFNLLEATLPSLLSKIAPAGTRGTANGVYSSSQFLGAFLGGMIGGYLYGWAGAGSVFAGSAALVSCWWLVSITMAQPRYLANIHVKLTNHESQDELLNKLLALPGVAEVWYVEHEGAAHLKVDQKVFKSDSIAELGLS
ncbi:MFS transporter [Aurantivibrio plasticivorans]